MTKLHAVLRAIGPCVCLSVLLGLLAPVAQAGGDLSSQSAQSSPAWLRDGVICEIFPRDFSPA
ncbi:MAG TPA: hypothetical protein VKS19_12420, partial [Verrucomicrobiae bacterium]|nr:hypothetical protein [Verrucomicrobiae bacterium]